MPKLALVSPAFKTYLQENREALRAGYAAYKAEAKDMVDKPMSYRTWALGQFQED